MNSNRKPYTVLRHSVRAQGKSVGVGGRVFLTDADAERLGDQVELDTDYQDPAQAEFDRQAAEFAAARQAQLEEQAAREAAELEAKRQADEAAELEAKRQADEAAELEAKAAQEAAEAAAREAAAEAKPAPKGKGK